MDLSIITKKIMTSKGLSKEASIAGVRYTFKLPSLEQQSLIDQLTTDGLQYKEGSEERRMLSQQLIARVIASSLDAIDGDVIPEVLNNKQRDLALYEEALKWPQALTFMLFRIAMDVKTELMGKLSSSIQYEWYGNEGFDMEPSDETIEKLAGEEGKQMDAKI